MNKPVCETMASRPADSQPGWSQWGVLSADGATFTPLHSLESALPTPSAYYYLAAAGICDVQGQPRAGAPMPEERPHAAPVQPQEPVEASPVASASVVDEPIPVAGGGTPLWVMGIGVVLLVIVFGAAFSKARRKQTDTTPPPKGFTFNGGTDDGNG